jgi:hypothetical protein
MSWESGEGFVITIVTEPARAVSLCLSKRSAPDGSAWMRSVVE